MKKIYSTIQGCTKRRIRLRIHVPYLLIYLKGNQDLTVGSKLEDFSPIFENLSDWSELKYASGSATILDKQNDKYITVNNT